jgi:hypothetical protein
MRAAQRPWPLTLLCIGGGLVLAWTGWQALGGGPARAFGPGYWLYFAVTTGALGVALWGVWQLRRWALWAFPGALLLDAAVVFAMGETHWGVLCLEGLLVLLVLSYARAFSPTQPKRAG